MQRLGLSPRGRRSRRPPDGVLTVKGSISAWAEEPPVRHARNDRPGVYLRVGGGAVISSQLIPLDMGLSPRGRRSLFDMRGTSSFVGSISAWAEEPNQATSLSELCRVYLRVGGGALRFNNASHRCGGLSPRGRRSQRVIVRRNGGSGSISAWAEEPIQCAGCCPMTRVYLRVGGGAF